MKKVGILGGTFNPVHMAHLLLADSALEMAGLDEILFIPSGCSYLKNADEILPAKDRIHMTGLAIEDNSSFALSTIEVEREGNSYTCETLLELKKLYPDREFYLIVGADNLYAMEEWKEPEVIFQNCEILAAVRGDKKREDLSGKAEKLKEKYGARISLLPIGQMEISSSLIRKRIAEGKSVRYMLPEKVRAYILKNHFYESEEQ